MHWDEDSTDNSELPGRGTSTKPRRTLKTVAQPLWLAGGINTAERQDQHSAVPAPLATPRLKALDSWRGEKAGG